MKAFGLRLLNIMLGTGLYYVLARLFIYPSTATHPPTSCVPVCNGNLGLPFTYQTFTTGQLSFMSLTYLALDIAIWFLVTILAISALTNLCRSVKQLFTR